MRPTREEWRRRPGSGLVVPDRAIRAPSEREVRRYVEPDADRGLARRECIQHGALGMLGGGATAPALLKPLILDVDCSQITGSNNDLINSVGDVSGNGFVLQSDGGAARPTLLTAAQNGHNILRFSGSQHLDVDLGTIGETSFTIIWLGTINTGNGGNVSRAVFGNINVVVGIRTNSPGTGWRNNCEVHWSTQDGLWQEPSSHNVVTGDDAEFCWEYDGASTSNNALLYNEVGSNLSAPIVATPSGVLSDFGGVWRFGGNNVTGTHTFMDLYQVRVYAPKLDATTRSSVISNRVAFWSVIG